ncbi:MAG: AAA family ATPase [Hyphomonadaceae bacterium]|nr:AAA family ATPase [Hyphomonadaceae bacterium]OQW58930.1 MAG: hypothetical protein A4S17_11400 [Proteobacteria bacterium HN_bin10]
MHVALAGHLGSGKSTLAKALGARLNAPIASFGAYVRVRAQEAGLDADDRTALQDLGQRLATEAPAAFVADFLARNGFSATPALIYDGVRHVGVWDAIAAHAGSLPVRSSLIFLVTSPETRRDRLAKRGHAPEQIAHWQSHAMERELDQIKAAADLEFDGAQALESLVNAFQAAVASSD